MWKPGLRCCWVWNDPCDQDGFLRCRTETARFPAKHGRLCTVQAILSLQWRVFTILLPSNKLIREMIANFSEAVGSDETRSTGIGDACRLNSLLFSFFIITSSGAAKFDWLFPRGWPFMSWQGYGSITWPHRIKPHFCYMRISVSSSCVDKCSKSKLLSSRLIEDMIGNINWYCQWSVRDSTSAIKMT